MWVWLSFLFGILGISFAAIFVRLALPAPPVITGFYRMLFATALLGAGFALRPTTLRSLREALRRPGAGSALAAGVCFGTDLALWNESIVATSVATATFLVNTTPIYVGLYAWGLQGQRLGPRFLWGSALALVGTATLLGLDGSSEVGTRGGALALCAALFYSGYLLWMKSARRGLDAGPAVALASASATAVLGVYGLALGLPFSGFPVHAWAAMGGAAVVSQIGGVMAIAWSLRYLRATFVSVALLGQPLGTACLGWILLDESLSPGQGLGGLAVLLGILAASAGGVDRGPAASS